MNYSLSIITKAIKDKLQLNYSNNTDTNIIKNLNTIKILYF